MPNSDNVVNFVVPVKQQTFNYKGIKISVRYDKDKKRFFWSFDHRITQRFGSSEKTEKLAIKEAKRQVDMLI